MQQEVAMTMDSRRSTFNRVARESSYRFGHSGLAGEPLGPDLAQIWRSPARSGLFLFFLCMLNDF
jgi:hypothetical protein